MREFGLELDAGKMENDIRLEEENRKLVELQTENERKKSDVRAYDFRVVSKMPARGVVFSDGIEEDAIEFNAGTEITVHIADKKGCLVV